MLICVTLFLAVVVAGCASLFAVGSEYEEKQAAYDDMMAKHQIANESTICYNQLIDELESIDYESDDSTDITPYIALIEDNRTKINDYVDAVTDFKTACRNYSMYIEPNSIENQQNEINMKICDDNIKTGQEALNKIGTVEEWLYEIVTWKACADNLTAHFNKTEGMSTGSEYYQWLLDTHPVLNDYFAESNTLSNETDMVIAILEPGKTRQSCIQIKNKLQTSNEQLKGLYNQMVDQYNTNVVYTYGIVPKV